MADDKVGVRTARPSEWKFPFLLTLALLTLLLLGLLILVSGGRDFSLAFNGSLVLFLIVGLRRGRVRDRLAVVGIAVLAYVSVELTRIYWVGFQTIEVAVRVLDVDIGRPVPDASVWLGDDPFVWLDDATKEWLGDARKAKPKGTVGQTDTEGRARLEHSFMAGGSEICVGVSGGPYLSGYTLKVEAAGYQGLQERLTKLIGPAGDANTTTTTTLLPVEVRLKKGAGEGRP
jgi:hypothetical protein